MPVFSSRLRQQPIAAMSQILCLEDVSARASREADPFGIDDPCPINPVGHHQPFVSGEDVVCFHCARIFVP